MNKNKCDYKYNFNTTEIVKDWTGHYKSKKCDNDITFTTYLGKSMADKLAKRYVENYQYPKRVVDMYYSLTNNRYMPGIYYVGKTKTKCFCQ